MGGWGKKVQSCTHSFNYQYIANQKLCILQYCDGTSTKISKTVCSYILGGWGGGVMFLRSDHIILPPTPSPNCLHLLHL